MNAYELLAELRTPARKKIILDTDAYNEIDDQYAISYAIHNPERIELLALCAAPFVNDRAATAAEGMQKSYEEILRLLPLAAPGQDIPVYRGSESPLPDKKTPVISEAAEQIVRLARESEERIYVVAIGAITNVASALLLAPDIIDKIAVIWLGANAYMAPGFREFNLKGDVKGAQVVFESGVALLQIPCDGVCSEFVTTLPELHYYMDGKNALCDYLLAASDAYAKGRYAYSKVIWDVTAIAILTMPEAFDTVVLPRPHITSDMRYAHDLAGVPYIYVRKIKRDPIYGDLFRRLGAVKEEK